MLALFQRSLNEFYIVWVIAVWYIGTVIGSCATLVLLRRRQRWTAKVVLIGAGVCYFGFTFAVAPPLWPSDSTLATFVSPSILGALSATIYLSAVITRCHGKSRTLPLFSLGAFIALILMHYRTTVPIELVACTWSTLYGLIVLSFTQMMYVRKHSDLTVDGRAATRGNQRPLTYLTGAKLLTILCYNLPFVYVAMQYFHLVAGAWHVDASKSLNHLIIFVCTRCVLGIFTIFDDTDRHDSNANAVVNHLSAAIYLTALMSATIVALLLLLNERLMNRATEYFIQNGYEFGAGVMVSSVYVTLSICIDSIGHSATISSTSIFGFGKRSQSLVFASCVEHLIDVSFVVAYLNRLIDTRLILMAMCFCGLSVGIQAILQSTATASVDRFESLQNFLKLEII